MINEKLDRLLNQLNTSPTTAKDKALGQVIAQLIKTLKDVADETNSIGSSVNNVVNNVNNFGKNNGLTVPLFDGESNRRFDDYSDNPYPSLTVAGSTIINNNTSNIINQNLLATGIESYGLETYADDPYPVMGIGGVVNNVINNNNNIINNLLLNTGIEKYELESYADNPFPSLSGAVPVASYSNITDDNSTNATMYPVWVTANSGALPLKVSSTRLSWNPSSGLLNITLGSLKTDTGIVTTFTFPSSGKFGGGSFDGAHSVLIENISSGTLASSGLRIFSDFATLILKVNSQGFTTSGFNVANNATIESTGSAGLVIGATNATGIMHFFTGGSAAANERMTILANGNVGIGVTAPTAKFQVAGGTASIFATTTDFVNGATGSVMVLKHGAATGNTYSSIGAYSAGGTVANNLVLNSDGGNVGVNTVSPGRQLAVTTAVNGNGIEIITTTAAQSPSLRFTPGNTDAASRNWIITTNDVVFGDFVIRYSNALGGDPYTAGTNAFYIKAGGNVGIGTTTPQAPFVVSNAGAAGIEFTPASGIIQFYNRSTAAYVPLVINASTFTFGIAGTAALVISAASNIRFNAYGAGAITADASGNLTSVSDERFKDRISNLNYGLNEILQLCPVKYGYNELSKLERNHLYGGFIAQDVQKIMPLAVGINSQGYLTLSDRPILGAVVTAIQQLTTRLIAVEERL